MAEKDSTLTQELLLKLFEYRDGNLYYKSINKHSRKKIGDKAGYINKCGYVSITIHDKAYLAHRLIFAYHYGFFPKYIDHINGNKSDNCIENLREATSQQNNWNRKRIKSPKYPAKGIYKHSKYDNKFCVEIYVNGQRIHIGIFNSINEAVTASNKARVKYHGEFARVC